MLPDFTIVKKRPALAVVLSLSLLATFFHPALARGRSGGSSGGRVSVKGYHRSDGTYVRPHTRSYPGSGGGSSLPSYGSSSLPTPSYDTLSPASPTKYLVSSQISAVDGDTFYYQGTRWRIVGIDTPEVGEPNYERAKQRLAQLLASGTVMIQQVGVDKYGRPLVKVFVNGQNVADILRREGLQKPRRSRTPRHGGGWATGSSILPSVGVPSSGKSLPPSGGFPTLSEEQIDGFVEPSEAGSRSDVAPMLPPVEVQPQADAATQVQTTDVQPEYGSELVLRVVVLDELTPKPVPLTDFVIRGNSSVYGQTVRTDEQGIAKVKLLSGYYTAESVHPTTYKGRSLFWGKTFEIKAGQTLELSLTDADATEAARPLTAAAPQPSLPVPAMPVRVPQAPRQVAQAPLQVDPAVACAEVNAQYTKWKEAWTKMALANYMSFYSPNVRVQRSDGEVYGYHTLQERMQARWSKETYIRLWDIGSPEIRLNGNRATLTVTQKYQSSSWGDQGLKRLVWEKVNGNWLIVDEQFTLHKTLEIAMPAKASVSPPRPKTSFAGEKFAATRYRYLDEGEVSRWSDEQIRYAINEMFARYGLDFNKPEVKQQFLRFPWYRPVDGRMEEHVLALFNQYERKNVQTIARVRDQRRAQVMLWE